ncbi:MAG: glycoside hydrolase family 15 protein [Candidatus Dormibacteria bacterium]
MQEDTGYPPISSYGLIGDCRSSALVSSDGSIDWCCLPRFDSPSIFGRLLDRGRGGSWQLAPRGIYRSRQAYADKTNILRTIFETDGGLAEVTDLMPLDDADVRQHARPHRHPRIIRIVTGLAGTVKFRQKLDLRPDYARVRARLKAQDGVLHADHDAHHFCFTSSIPLQQATQDFTVGPGDTVVMALTVNHRGRCGTPASVAGSRRLLRSTQQFWWRWISICTYNGPYQEQVWRSALALKLLTYAPTGAIVAAPTTSLPESIGGERNWDYRFTWLRDASFTLYSLFQLGYVREASDFMEWVCHLALSEGLHNLYNLDGNQVGTAERELDYLAGYRGSRPVRVGNGASDQLQLDVYGELIDSAYLFATYGGTITPVMWEGLQPVIDFAARNWELPDASLWEVRGKNLQFTYSKAMCWVAVDRGIHLARRFKLPADLGLWEKARRVIHRRVMKDGFSAKLGTFVQAFGEETIDASALRLVQMNFLRSTDPRLKTTIRAVDKALSAGPLVYRYRLSETDDGLDGGEGSFLICAYWMADALALVGDLESAERRFERLLAFSSPLGLISEEVDTRTGALLGNFPQAFSHLAQISAAVNIERRRNRALGTHSGVGPPPGKTVKPR